MFCQFCGAQMAESDAFCTKCGAQNAAVPATAPPHVQPAEPSVSPITVLIFGIISVALSSSTLPAIIFGIIGLLNANKYTKEGGALTGKVKIGRILSIVGLVLGCAALVMAIVSGFFSLVISGILRGVLSEIFDQMSQSY